MVFIVIHLFPYAVVFIFGLVIGSFLNVVIHRLPRNESIVRPRSHCPHCGKQIAAYDNIPVLSYILLRGRCRFCRGHIAFRYPAVELLEALLMVALVVRFGFTIQTLPLALFVSVLLVISFIDIDLQIIPDRLTYPMIGLGILGAGCQWLVQLVWPWREFWPIGAPDALIGGFVGLGTLMAIIQIYLLLTGKEGMGLGDVKMLSMIGLFLGWEKTLLTLFMGCFVGSLVSIPLMLFSGKSRSAKISFGPFLAIGAVFSLFYGDFLIGLYRYSLSPEGMASFSSPW